MELNQRRTNPKRRRREEATKAAMVADQEPARAKPTEVRQPKERRCANAKRGVPKACERSETRERVEEDDNLQNKMKPNIREINPRRRPSELALHSVKVGRL